MPTGFLPSRLAGTLALHVLTGFLPLRLAGTLALHVLTGFQPCCRM